MKKVIIAAAIGAFSTVASAQVSLGGRFHLWQDNTKIGNASVTNIANENSNHINITATERISNGLTARAVVETSLRGNNIEGSDTRLGDRTSVVGLASSLGSIDLGRNLHSHYNALAANDPFRIWYGSIAGDVHHLRGARLSDSTFISVTPHKDVRVNFDRSQTPGQEAYAVSVSGSLGPVRATLARFHRDAELSTVYGVNAQLKNTRLFYSHSDNEGVVKSKGDLVGVHHQMGSYAAKASYGRTNTDVTAYNVGLDYALSKRTEVGVVYRVVDKVATAADVRQIGVGIKHNF
jgi:predicted porin